MTQCKQKQTKLCETNCKPHHQSIQGVEACLALACWPDAKLHLSTIS
jgi:hypothetical protein